MKKVSKLFKLIGLDLQMFTLLSIKSVVRMYLSSLNCTFFGGGLFFYLFKIFWKPNFYSNELRINYILEDNILKEKKIKLKL